MLYNLEYLLSTWIFTAGSIQEEKKDGAVDSSEKNNVEREMSPSPVIADDVNWELEIETNINLA